MLDPKSVLMRKDRMMKYHLGLFEDYFGEFEQVSSAYFFGDDNNWISISYNTLPKFLTKIFTTRIKMNISDLDMPESWSAKLQFLGNFKVTGIAFRENRNIVTQTVSRMNEDKELLDRIYSQTDNFDMQSMELKYSKDTKELVVELEPFAGALIWVKLPPIYHDVRLKDFEVKGIYGILKVLENYFTRNYSSSNQRSMILN